MTTESKKPFTSRDEGIENNLCSIKEISKLSLPDGQELWLSDAHTVLKAQNSLFRERAVTHLEGGIEARHIKGKTFALI